MSDEVRPESSLSGPTKVAMWSALIVAWLGWLFDGMEMGLYSWSVPRALHELLPNLEPSQRQPYLAYTVSLFLIGMSAGGLFFGRLGDTLGRVKTLMITVLVYATFTGLSGFVTSFEQLAVCRFLGAMGLGGEWGLGVALVMETWPNAKRPLLAGVLGAAANVGFLVAAWFTKWLANHPEVALFGRDFQNWRIALMFGFVPAILTLVVRLFVKESERYEEVKDKARESKLSELWTNPALRYGTLVGTGLAAVAVLGMWGVFQAWVQSWVQEITEVAKAALPDAARQLEVDMARARVGEYMAYGAIIGSLFGGVLAEKMGRRASYAFYCVGAIISALLLFLTNTEVNARMLMFVLLGGAFSAAFFGWLPLYLPELFPTRLRATGEGLTFNAGRVLSGIGVLFTGALAAKLGGPAKACAIMSVIYLLGLVIIPFARETRNLDLATVDVLDEAGALHELGA